MTDIGADLQKAYDDGFERGWKEASEKYQAVLSRLRGRCYPGAEMLFDNMQYGLIKIVTINK